MVSNFSITTRWAPCTRIRSVPSGTLSMRDTTPATPTRYTSSGPGSSISGSLLATITSIRLPPSTSFTRLIDRS